MANDKETGIKISVEAEADVKSAEVAAEKIEKGVLSKLKDGYIPIPVEIKAPIEGASKELKQAQEDVIKQWEETFSKGFSSSKKDLNKLSDAYKRFKRLGSSKADTKQYEYISSLMGKQIQEYDRSRTTVANRRKRSGAGRTRVLNDPNAKKDIITDKSDPSNPGVKVTERMYLNAEKDLKKILSIETAKGIRGVFSHLQLGRGWNTDGVATSLTLQETERQGSYGSNWARQIAQSRAEARKQEIKSLVIAKYGKEGVKEFLDRLHLREYTEQEKAKGYSDIAASQTKDASARLRRGRDTEQAREQLRELLPAIFSFSNNAGDNLWKPIQKSVESTLAGLYTTKGTLGVGYDESKEDAAFANDEFRDAVKEMLTGMKKVAKQELKDQKGLTAEAARQLEVLASIDSRAAAKEIDKYLRGTQFGSIWKDVLKSVNKDDAVTNALKSSMKEVADTNKEQVGVAQSTLNQTRIEGAAERVADVKEQELQTADAETGLNTDEAKEAVLANQATANKTAKESNTLLDKLNDALLSTNFAGGQYPYQNALYGILMNLVHIGENVVDIRDNMGKRWRTWQRQ